MKRFIIEQSDEHITSHSGLSLIGTAIRHHTHLADHLDAIPLRHGMAHSDLVISYLGLLSIGKNDFEAMEAMRDNDFFKAALGLEKIPTADRTRQRVDERASDYLPALAQASIDFLQSSQATITPLPMGHVPLDMDVTPFDNSGSQKEGVSFTYKKHDGYAPMAAYLGQEGYCVEFELREGKQHCQNGTPALIQRALEKSVELTDQPILLRLDGGNDSIENVDIVLEFNEQHPQAGVDFVIKWNPRTKDVDHWLEVAEQQAEWEEPRPGKRVGLFEVMVERKWRGHEYTIRRAMRIVERTIDRHGQHLAVPEIEIEGWWTSLWNEPQEIIDLYADHGTSEQFHSEFKTDMDIERLPSGKFATNEVVLAGSVLIYNILRYLGQNGLTGPDAPLRHPAKRRRIRTVMQELMYLAGRFVRTGRRLKLQLGSYCQVKEIFARLYKRLTYG